jgi:excisionase family DNA binding protein
VIRSGEVFFYPSGGGGRNGAEQEDGRMVFTNEITLTGEVPLVAYALSLIVSLSGVSALEAYHRNLLRDSVGGSEVCCRLDTHLLYHEGKVLLPGAELEAPASQNRSTTMSRRLPRGLESSGVLWNHRGMNKRSSTVNTNPASVLPPRGLRIMDAANYMGVTAWYVEEVVRSGELPALMLCRHYTILKDDADAFLDRKREEVEKRRADRSERGLHHSGNNARQRLLRLFDSA